MVRNHQDGHPYINLSFFVVVENIQKHQCFFGKIDWSMNSGPGWAGIARDIKKYFYFQNLTKNRNKVWTIKKAKMILLFSSVLHFFVVVENIQNHKFLLEKIIGQ